MRYLALDVGTKTVGIAISDKTNVLASPLLVLNFQQLDNAVSETLKIIREHNITDCIIGLPKNMNNTQGFATNRSLQFKALLAQYFTGNIHLIDERLTTLEAEKILINQDVRPKKRKSIIDALAATLILESYLKKVGNKNE